MQEQLREEEKKLFNQTDTFENFADDSEGEIKDVKSRNPRIIGAMEASDSESEVSPKLRVYKTVYFSLSDFTLTIEHFNVNRITHCID